MAEEADMSEVATKDSTPGAASQAKSQAADEGIAKFLEVLGRGDPASVPVSQALLANEEVGQALVDRVGSSAEWLRLSLISRAGGKNALVQEAIRRRIAAVQAELEGPSPTPIERLLAERAAICWFMTYWYEHRFQESDVHQPRIDKAHARFLSSLRTLAHVRKLAVPALQVNVAASQVNVAGGAS
jgi:hypothetical protein